MNESLAVTCGQLLVVGLASTELEPRERTLLASGLRGGVVLFRRNIAEHMYQVALFNDDVHRIAPEAYPPLIAVDQEGGRVMRLGPPAMQLPAMARIGALDDVTLTEALARAQSEELRALGFTMNFAPVADVHTRPQNPVIGDRAFGPSAAHVERHATAFATGMRKAGLLSCAKHFPGHGDTLVDSHLALPRVDRPLSALEQAELPPFAALSARTGVDSMMTAHVVYDSLDPQQPATLSHALCTRLLRDRLGFSGVLFSDDLEMKALSMSPEESAVRAVAAGCDALLVCSRADVAERAHEALIHEAETSAAFAARVREAFARGVRMRRRSRARAITHRADLEAVFASHAPLMASLAHRLEAAAEALVATPPGVA